MARLQIKTAQEFIDLDWETRWRTRRAARETRVFQWILGAFLDRGGPISVGESIAAFHDSTEATQQALASLDRDDLIRIRDGWVDIAYPFSASPTPFVVQLSAGEERYACCALDALGIAAMVGQPVAIRSHCHHCTTPLEFSATPDGPGAGAAGIMLWVGKRVEDGCRVADSL